MRIFVTGGTGFVGGHLVRRLVERGHDLVLLARAGSRRQMEHPRVVYREGDIVRPQTIRAALSGCNRVIHLVGIIREVRGGTFEQIHAEAVRHLVSQARETGIQKIVHMSALGTRPGARSRYHQTKWEGEEAVRQSRIPYVIFRPSIIVGPDDHLVNLFLRLLRLPTGVVPVLGNGKNLLQPVWVEDVAACFARAVEDDAIGNREVVLAGPEAMTFDDLLDRLMRFLGVRRLKAHLPWRLAGWLGRALEKMPGAPLTRDQVVMLEEDNTGDITAMRRDFGLEPKPLEEVLPDYFR